MASNIAEYFGYAPRDPSPAAHQARKHHRCPFIATDCTKTLSDGTVSGACTLEPVRSGPVIICPNRLYDDGYAVLSEVASLAFGPGTRFIAPSAAKKGQQDGKNVVVFGKGWGGELRLPQRRGTGGYFVDWILARVGTNGLLNDFVAVEVQAIDTTGNYRAERDAYALEQDFDGFSSAGLNWENVSKRILPQLIYKGHVLRLERRCQKGLFFICPTAVWERIRDRLGGIEALMEYQLQPGAITFCWYDVTGEPKPGHTRALVPAGTFTTTVDQVALAFTAPKNLPDAGVYEEAITRELGSARRTTG